VKKVAGLILAAGASIRMGRPKQLLSVRGISILDLLLDEVLNSELDLGLLVLGHQAQEIRESLKTDLNHPKLQIIENKNYRDGISSSIVTGLTEVEGRYDHVMIILADIPRITSNLINHLLRQYLASRMPLGAITINNRRTHPVIFGRGMYHELHQLRGDRGARDIFLKYPDQVCLVEPEEDYDDRDIDTPEDYLDFIKTLGGARDRPNLKI
jgi:molybdenum cofactor cytidylyltransferase